MKTILKSDKEFEDTLEKDIFSLPSLILHNATGRVHGSWFAGPELCLPSSLNLCMKSPFLLPAQVRNHL